MSAVGHSETREARRQARQEAWAEGGARECSRDGWWRSRWWQWVVGLAVLAVAVRVAAVLGNAGLVAHGDSDFYTTEANLLVTGHGWINPFTYYGPTHAAVPSAAFPPLFTLVLAAASAAGAKSFLAHRLWCCLIGSLAVPLAAVVGRRLGGTRTGLIAAAVTALYPNLWLPDALGMSETLSPVLVLVVLLLAYRLWDRRTWRAAGWLGLSIGITALGRDELALLAVLILLPMAMARRMGPFRHRVRLLVAGGLAAAIAVAPIVAFNLTRFDTPVYISDGLGVTLASANCPLTYHGPSTGYWSIVCAGSAPTDSRADEAVQGAEEQAYAMAFIRRHAGELPLLSAERLGRAFGVFRPLQQIQFDSFLESRPRHWALTGLGTYYGLVLLSVGGVVVLRRRGLPVYPLLAVGADVVVSVVLTFGQTRYRSTFEVSLVLLAAVGVDALLRRRPAGLAAVRDAGLDDVARARVAAVEAPTTVA